MLLKQSNKIFFGCGFCYTVLLILFIIRDPAINWVMNNVCLLFYKLLDHRPQNIRFGICL